MTQQRHDRRLKSWSHAYGVTCDAVALKTSGDWTRVLELAESSGRPLIPRGAGLSWTDIAMADHGLAATTAGMSQIVAFDAQAGAITAQGGATLRMILNAVEPHGWTLRCLPGSLDITLGGAIACNVHGKDAHRQGAFCEQVESLALLDGRSRRHRVQRTRNPRLFDATAGGMGLTGLIAEATLALAPLPSSHIAYREISIDSMAALQDLVAQANDHDFIWGWMDPARAMHGEVRALASLGTWDMRKSPGEGKGSSAPAIPWSMMAPFVTAARGQQAMSLLHRWCLQRHDEADRTMSKPWRDVLFPHARLAGLDRLFARSGFTELQAIIPLDRLEQLFDGLRALPEANRLRAFLVSFKVHRASPGFLTFAGEGLGISFVTTVFDQEARDLEHRLAALRALIARCRRRINLHRDGGIPLSMTQAMYPGFDNFLKVKVELDPGDIINSGFWARLMESRRHDG